MCAQIESSGSSAGWDPAERLLFAWLEEPATELDRKLRDLQQADPPLGQAVGERLARLRQMGWLGDGRPRDDAVRSGPQSGESFGDYRIVRPLGVGGMGAVYLAEQTSLGREVALKVIRGDRLRDQGARERFHREAKIIANIRHPGICAVLDVGEVEHTPYLAMQHVAGQTLADRLSAQRMGSPESSSGPSTQRQIAATLETVEKIARALHAAHEAGVIHRDVKPGNVMIDERGEPVLLDFGLARTEDASASAAALTMSGDVLGTPAYMSPEQVRPGRGTMDRRTDVYSLGITLYECVTLQRPFVASSPVALYEKIEHDPTPDPRRLNPHLPVDLSAVIHKTTEKDSARRYATAAEFADELRRVRLREPVRARRIGTVSRAWRWAQRSPVAASLLVVLAVGLASTSLLLTRTIHQRDTIDALARSRRTGALIGAAAAEQRNDPSLSTALALRALELEATPEAAEQLRSSFASSFELGVLRGHTNVVHQSHLSADGAVAATGSYDGTVRIWGRDGAGQRVFDIGSEVQDLNVLDDGRVLCAAADGAAYLCDPEDGTHTAFAWQGEQLPPDRRAMFAARPLTDRSGIACAGAEGILRIHDLDGGELQRFDHPAAIWKVEVGPGPGRFVATADYTGTVRLFDLDRADAGPSFEHPRIDPRTGERTFVDCIRFSPDGGALLIADWSGGWALYDLGGGVLATGTHGVGGEGGARIRDVAWAPSGQSFLTVGDDDRGRLWNRDGTLVTILSGHSGPIYCCGVAPDGSFWATAGEDMVVRLWTARGDPFAELRGHGSPVSGAISFAADGRTMLTAATDTTARLWDLSFEGMPILQSSAGTILRAVFVAQRDEVVAGTSTGLLQIWPRTGGPTATVPTGDAGWISAIAADADGQQVVIGKYLGTVQVVDLRARAVVRTLPPIDANQTLVDADPERGIVMILRGGWGGAAPVLEQTDFELSAPRLVATLEEGCMVHRICMPAGGDAVYLACGDGRIRIFGLDGVERAPLVGHTDGVMDLDFSPDRATLVSAGVDRTVRLWDVGSGQQLAVGRGHRSDVMRARFAPDGERIATAARDSTARVWSRDLVPIATLRDHQGTVFEARFDPEGRYLLTAAAGGLARLWHADVADLETAARARPRRELSDEELQRYGELLGWPPDGSDRPADGR